MSKTNIYDRVTLEEFAQLIPQRTDVVYVGQRQSGRTLAMDLINLIHRRNGDPTEVVPYDYINPVDGIRGVRLSPIIGNRSLFYKGQKHVCGFGRLDSEQDAGQKRVYQICPKSYAEVEIEDLPSIWLTQLFMSTGEQLFLLKTQRPDGNWAVTAFITKRSSSDPFGPLVLADASENLLSVMSWLSRYNLVPISGAPLVNPYWQTEEEYIRTLQRDVDDIDALKHLMAQEFFKVSEHPMLRTNAGTPNERLHGCAPDDAV